MLITTVPLLIFLIHCSPSKTKSDVSTIVLEENQKIIELNPIKKKYVLIEKIHFPRIYLEGNNVIVYGPSLESRREFLFYTYDKDLNLLGEKRFTIGQGPWELGGAPYFFPVGDRIYVPDNTQRRISIFDRNFNFIRFVKTEFALNSPIFSKDGKFFIFVTWEAGRYGPTSSFSVYLVTFPGLKKRLLHPFPEFDCILEGKREFVLDNGAIHYFLKNDKIYLLDKAKYVITIRNNLGDIEKQVRINVERIPTPKNMEDKWLKEHMGINKHLAGIRLKLRLSNYVQPSAWMIPLEKGFVVIRQKGYSPSCRGLVDADYFDFDLNMLGKVKFPCFNEIFHLRRHIFLLYADVSDGFLYLVNNVEREDDEVIALEKWKISE